MFGNKSKSKPKTDSAYAQAVVRQDSQTSVKTTTAQSETTNTTVQSATIFNSERNTVTLQTTRQTVTHQQKARITEIVRRLEPTEQDLEELLRKVNINKGDTNAKRKSGNFATSGSSVGGISSKSAPKFKSSAVSPVTRFSFNYDQTPTTPTTPTVARMQEVTVTQKDGRTVTTTAETKAIKLKWNAGGFKLSSPSSPLSPNYNYMPKSSSGASSAGQAMKLYTDAKAFSPPVVTTTRHTASSSFTSTPTYTSPYSQRTLSSSSSSSLVQPAAPRTSSSLVKPAAPRTSSSLFQPAVPRTTSSLVQPAAPHTSSAFGRTTSTVPASSSASRSSATVRGSAPTLSASTSSAFNREFGTNNISPLRPPATALRPTVSSFALTPSPSYSISSNGSTKKTSKLKPGRCYIFNHVKFDAKKYPKAEEMERVGSTKDVERLCDTFAYFKLKTEIIKNATVDEVRNTVKKIEKEDFSKRSCIVVVILSHGDRFEKIYAKDGTYSIDDHVMFPLLRNKTLDDKPKIFFVQACKGGMSIENAKIHKDAVLINQYGSPNEILKCYSTFEGFISYRSEENGSIFIRTLCEQLKVDGMTRNVKDIVDTVISKVKTNSGGTQIPAATTTLTKSYVFGDHV